MNRQFLHPCFFPASLSLMETCCMGLCLIFYNWSHTFSHTTSRTFLWNTYIGQHQHRAFVTPYKSRDDRGESTKEPHSANNWKSCHSILIVVRNSNYQVFRHWNNCVCVRQDIQNNWRNVSITVDFGSSWIVFKKFNSFSNLLY